jgi:hypothetical protein
MSSYDGEDTPTDMDAILESARVNNRADGITGLLIFHDGSFFQVLEGPREKVLACYARIERNLLHRGCTVLESKEIERRNFTGWDMAYVPFAELDAAHQKNFIDLQTLKKTGKMDELSRDRRTGFLVNAFLTSFVDLQVA